MGAGVRSSTATKATSATSATAPASTTGADPQPAAPPRTMASTAAISPLVSSRSPRASTARGSPRLSAISR